MTSTNVPSPPDAVERLVWRASADYQFTFLLDYDAKGEFQSVKCEMRGRQVTFSNDPYDLPLALAMKDRSDRDVNIQMRVVPSRGPYAWAVWCNIKVPGYAFDGIALAFSADESGPAPVTVW